MHYVNVDRGIEHMLGWGQRIATRTSVESPFGCGPWKKHCEAIKQNESEVSSGMLLVSGHFFILQTYVNRLVKPDTCDPVQYLHNKLIRSF